jgi:hypothetical protein
MKMFLSRNELGIVEGAGGYIIGDGKLPDDFNPDAFMKRFSRATIMAAARGNKQAIGEILGELPVETEEEIDAHAEEAAGRVDAAIDAAPTVELKEKSIEDTIKYIEEAR